jgi:hypothetical protein
MKEKTIPFVFTYLQKTIEENPSGSGYLVGRKVYYYEIRINRGILIFSQWKNCISLDFYFRGLN